MSQPHLDRARQDFDAKFTGMNKAGKRPVLPPGMKFTPTAQTRQELSYVAGRRLTMMEITAGFDVPIALFDASANRANVEGSQYHHAKYGIQPRLRKIEERMNERLAPMYGKNLFLAFDNPVPDDNQYTLDARVKQTGVPFLSIDEARTEIGEEAYAIPGVTDIPWIPINYQAMPMSVPTTPPAAPGTGTPAVPGSDDTEEVQARSLAAKTLRVLKEKLG